MSIRLLVATGNNAKLQECQAFLGDNFTILNPKELGIEFTTVEDGSTIRANAEKKLLEHLEALRGNMLYVLADDTGLEIDALSGAPGHLTRRWLDDEGQVNDEDLEAHCLKLLEPYSMPEDRGAVFRTVICLGSTREGFLGAFEGILRGTILKRTPSDYSVKVQGFPFRNIFYVTEYGKTIGQLDALKSQQNILMARERALAQVKEYLIKKDEESSIEPI